MEKDSTIVLSYSKEKWAANSDLTEVFRSTEKKLFAEVVNSEVKKLQNTIKKPIEEALTNNVFAQSDDKGPYKLDFFELSKAQDKFTTYSKNYSTASQKWVGYITSINPTNIIARLKDLTNGGTDEEAEIEIEDISPDDRPLISLGATFYWTIGKEMINGQIKNESLIRFKRTPWKVEEFDTAMDLADNLSQGLEWI